MAKRYAILQKKLEQLESDLLQVLSLPPETPCHQLLSEGIKQRFIFFTNLLSTELASASASASPSHSSKSNYQLRHLANRLSQFESAFRDWDHHQISSLAAPATAETCSCTESCVNDDGDLGSTELGDQAFYEYDCDDDHNDDYVEMFEEPVVEEKATMATAMAMESVGVERDVKREEEKEGRVWGWRRYCGVMGGGVVVGALLMGFVMVRFCDCFNCYSQHGDSLSLIPT